MNSYIKFLFKILQKVAIFSFLQLQAPKLPCLVVQDQMLFPKVMGDLDGLKLSPFPQVPLH